MHDRHFASNALQHGFTSTKKQSRKCILTTDIHTESLYIKIFVYVIGSKKIKMLILPLLLAALRI